MPTTLNLHSNRLAARLARMRGQEQPAAPDTASIDPTLAACLDHLEVMQRSRGTIRNYRQDIAELHVLVGRPLLEADQDDLTRAIATLARRGLKASTIRRKISVWSGFFQWCVKTRRRPDNPAAMLDKPKTPARVPVHLDERQVSSMRGVLQPEGSWRQVREAAIMGVLYYTGAEPGSWWGSTGSGWTSWAAGSP